jgi:hypothetical protein
MADEKQTVSINLGDMTVAELIQVNQGLGHDIERIRERRKYLQGKIAERLAAGEREHPAEVAAPPEGGDAAAPGAVIEASAAN